MNPTDTYLIDKEQKGLLLLFFSLPLPLLFPLLNNPVLKPLHGAKRYSGGLSGVGCQGPSRMGRTLLREGAANIQGVD